MTPEFHPAMPEMASVATPLIYLTMGKMADYLFGADDPHRARGYLKYLFRAKNNRFSYQFGRVASLTGNVTGLVIAYPGQVMKALELPTAYQLVKGGGVRRFVHFIKRALPLVGTKEAEEDEYSISNIAVLPAFQGQGIGKFMLSRVEKIAVKQGFKKLSLTVDVENINALGLYKRIGFQVVETLNNKFLARKIDYHGTHRMVKSLV